MTDLGHSLCLAAGVDALREDVTVLDLGGGNEEEQAQQTANELAQTTPFSGGWVVF